MTSVVALSLLPFSGFSQTPEPGPTLPLPELPALPQGLDNSPNPLLDFDKAKADARIGASDAALPPLSPFMPGEVPPSAAPPPSTPPTPAQKALVALAEKVASAVVSIRVWDQFGGLLSSGVGCFVSSDGLILTDASLLHPEFASRIDYITTTAANGANHRITGFYVSDLSTGVALLQGDGPTPHALELDPEAEFSKPRACRVVALSDKRGLLIADAEAAWDDTLAGQGWLTLRGEDSPGGVGSPILDDSGRVIGVVAMKTPIDSWMNFGLPAGWAAFEAQKKRPPLKSLKELPKSPSLAQVSADPDFLAAFQQIQSRAMAPATRTLLRLTKRYPRSPECWALLGICSGFIGATPDALACQRRAVALNPESGLHWHQMAVASLRNRAASGQSPDSDAPEEYQALLNATRESPNDRLSWLMLATHHIRSNRLAEAEEALRRLTLLSPSYARGFYLLAYVKTRLREPDAAVQALERCLDINRRQPAAWYFLGLILDNMNDPRKAADAYRQAVRFDAGHPQAWLNLARSLKRANRPTEAASAFREHQKRVLAAAPNP
jgi:tetratricopeptide (TPR) repeat protein